MSKLSDNKLPPRRATEAGRLDAADNLAGLSQLDRSTDPFIASVRATRTATLITDPRLADNPIVFANDAFCRLTGYSREEILGRNCRFLQGPETDPTLVARLRAAIAANEPIEIDLRNHRKDGSPFWNRLLVAPVHDANGTLIYFFANQTDVTLDHERIDVLESLNADLMAEAAARLRAEAALRESKELLEQQVVERTAALQASETRLRANFESSLQFQGLLALDGTLLDANAASLEAINAQLEDVVGQHFWDTPWFADTPGMPEMVHAGVLSALQGQSIRQDILVNLPTGLRSFDFAMRPIRGKSGAIIAIVPEGVETTGRRQAEEAFRQAQKMEAVGQLTGGIAHDFNNMLQSVGSGLELARRRLEHDRIADAAMFMEMARKGVDRAAALTQRLLAFARRHTLEPHPVRVDELVRSLMELIKASIGPTIEVETQLCEGSWLARCDANQLESALLNLAINARDAMPDGGTVTLSTQEVSLTQGEIAGEDGIAPGDYLLIAVSDTGIGMQPEVLARVLEPFFTTKPLGQGTGLGLSQVYGFARQSGGKLRLESTPDQGTTVSLLLPRDHSNENGFPALAPPLESEETGAGRTVLLVDDEAPARAMTAEILRDRGYIVLEAQDGMGGLQHLAGNIHVDVLITDLGLPGGLNGRQLADAVRARRPGLPVLFITGYAGGLLDGELAPRMEVMRKPYTLGALSDRLWVLLESAVE